MVLRLKAILVCDHEKCVYGGMLRRVEAHVCQSASSVWLLDTYLCVRGLMNQTKCTEEAQMASTRKHVQHVCRQKHGNKTSLKFPRTPVRAGLSGRRQVAADAGDRG